MDGEGVDTLGSNKRMESKKVVNLNYKATNLYNCLLGFPCSLYIPSSITSAVVPQPITSITRLSQFHVSRLVCSN